MLQFVAVVVELLHTTDIFSFQWLQCILFAISFSGDIAKRQRPGTSSDGVGRPARNYRGMLDIPWLITSQVFLD